MGDKKNSEAPRGESLKSGVVIRPLAWDTGHFGVKVGKIDLDQGTIDPEVFREEQDRERYDLIYGFSEARNTPARLWESLGFYLMDTMITLSMPFQETVYRGVDHQLLNDLSKKDREACYEIAESVAPMSRFYREPMIGPALTKKMYRAWIDSALDKSFSDGLFVVKLNGQVTGIHTVRTMAPEGHFTLTGIRQGFRRRGLGQSLWRQSYGYWAQGKSPMTMIKSKFSMRNADSYRFHLAQGFAEIESIKHIYHYVRKLEN